MKFREQTLAVTAHRLLAHMLCPACSAPQTRRSSAASVRPIFPTACSSTPLRPSQIRLSQRVPSLCAARVIYKQDWATSRPAIMRCAKRMRPLIPNQPPTRTDAQCTRRHNKWDKCSSEVMIRSAFILPVYACTNAPLTLMPISFAARRVALARLSASPSSAPGDKNTALNSRLVSFPTCLKPPSACPVWHCRSGSRSSSSAPHVARAASSSSAWCVASCARAASSPLTTRSLRRSSSSACSMATT